MTVAAYLPVWCKSNYAFLEGASHPEELVEQAHMLGLPGIAITDRDGVYGIVRAHKRARELGIRLVIGAQVSVDDGSQIVLLAGTRTAYAALCRLLTAGRLRSEKGLSAVTWEEVVQAGDGEAGLLALWGGAQGLITAPPGPRTQRLPEVAGTLRDAFGDRLYAMVARHRLAEEFEAEARLRTRALHYGLPLVAAVEVLYHHPARRPLQDVLSCIRAGVCLDEAGCHIRSNAEHALKSPHAFSELFEDLPGAVAGSLSVLERCEFNLDALRYRYPAEELPDGMNSAEWLRQLTFEGAHERYGGEPPPEVSTQLNKELDLIEELEYPGYFLTMKEIVEHCRAHGILCQGRGSAANSAVCYCLGITAVDPVRMGLLFERFLSRERREPPDIDLDIAHERREEVIQWVYERYGRERAAMVINIIRYRTRSAIREVGKALGLPETALDRLAKTANRSEQSWATLLRIAGLDPETEVHQHLVERIEEIRDFPRHVSIHPGGFLLGHEPVHDIVPIENAAMDDRTVIQWDKDDLDELGLFKVDLLALGSLSLVDRCFEMLAALDPEGGPRLDMATVPADDGPTYDMICAADTIGLFQIESRAQMSMLPRLRPRKFYDLVIEISIVRPGPIAGDMVHPYLRRRRKEEPIEYPHDSLEPVLERTLGVPLFQEQVMKLAVVAADYTPGEADQLRRDMAAWRRSGRIEQHREKLVSRMLQKGIAQEFAERVFEQIRGFGEYGFPESHAASFAHIAYVTAWLRCHHIEAYTCALLNAQPMGFYSPSTIIEDAKRHGVEVRPVDVVHSDWDCTLEPLEKPTAWQPARGGRYALRMGLRYVDSFGEQEADKLLDARDQAPFRDLVDLVRRSRLFERELIRLAEAGAFESLQGPCRREALWALRRLIRERQDDIELETPEAPLHFRPLDVEQTISWDYRTTNHSPRGHPLGPWRPQLHARGLIDSDTLRRTRDGRRVRYAGLVTCRQRPGTAKGVVFMTLEDEAGQANIVVWSKVFEKYAHLASTEGFLGIEGRVQNKEGITHLVADRLFVPRLPDKPAHGGSRDFH